MPEDGEKRRREISGLRIEFIDNEVEAESRALLFYVALPNEIVNSGDSLDGRRFVSWRYRLGQRMQLRVPIQQWRDRIVLPIDAVAQSGAEYYVFQQNGSHFDRVPVHVEYRDQYNVVIANDGALFPGDVVALAGAHQMQMALKNKAGGGVDPHAGHTH
jgi:multidrug efflux pump subunit AcrA (membrane-fusion protein)